MTDQTPDLDLRRRVADKLGWTKVPAEVFLALPEAKKEE